MAVTDRIKVWDAPLRLFHWLLAGSVGGAFVTGWLGGNLIVWHGRLGLLVLGLLAFRLIWGLLGTTYARWTRICAAPLGVAAYLRGQWPHAGHNPLGSLSVLVLLGWLGFQVFSGLVASDDIAFRGPLYPLVDSELAASLTGLHRQAKWPLLLLIGLHVLAIVFYTVVKRQALVRAMVSGYARRHHPAQPSAEGSAWWALLLAVGFAVLVVWLVQTVPDWLAPPPSVAPPALSW